MSKCPKWIINSWRWLRYSSSELLDIKILEDIEEKKRKIKAIEAEEDVIYTAIPACSYCEYYECKNIEGSPLAKDHLCRRFDGTRKEVIDEINGKITSTKRRIDDSCRNQRCGYYDYSCQCGRNAIFFTAKDKSRRSML